MSERQAVAGTTYPVADLAALCYHLAAAAYPNGAPWRQATFAADIRLAHTHYTILMVANQPVGFVSLTTVLDETEITNIVILPAFRRQGLAYWLLTTALAQLAVPSQIFLEVRAKNQAAQRLYQRCGFESLSVRREYYQDPVEDALIMRKIMN